MATPPREDPIASDDPINTGAKETDLISDFIDGLANEEDTQDISNLELVNMDFDNGNFLGEMAASTFDMSDANFSQAEFAPIDNSGVFTDLDNQDTTAAVSDNDPFSTVSADASAAANPAEGVAISTLTQDITGAKSDANSFGEEVMGTSAAIISLEDDIPIAVNHDTTMVTSDTDPFGADPVNTIVAPDSFEHGSLSASNSRVSNEARKSRRDKNKRRVSENLPAAADIIDLDSYAATGTYSKSEDGKVVFIKAEPGSKFTATPFIKWPNTKDEPICLDDDDDDPVPSDPSSVPKVGQIAKEDEKKSTSSSLEDMPMQDVSVPDVSSPSDEFETSQEMSAEDHSDGGVVSSVPMEIEPFEEAPSLQATMSNSDPPVGKSQEISAEGHSNGGVVLTVPMEIDPFEEAPSLQATMSKCDPPMADEMEIEPATSSKNGDSLNKNHTSASLSSNSGLGNSILTEKAKPSAGKGRSSFRDKLKQAQQQVGRKTQRGQKVNSGEASSNSALTAGPSSASVLALPAHPIPDIPSTPASPLASPISILPPANSSAPRAPAPPFQPSISGPSSVPAQQNDNHLFVEDFAGEPAQMDPDFCVQPTDDEYWHEYLDAFQKLKDKKLAYRARGGDDEEMEIELMKEQGELDGLKRQLLEDKEYDEIEAPGEDSLFVPDDFAALANFNNEPPQILESEPSADPRGRSGASAGKKGRGGKSKVGKTPKSKSKSNNDKIRDKASKVSKKPAKPKKKRGGGSDDNRMLDVGSLFNSNVIQAAQANVGRAPLAALDSTRRAEALKQLVASVPLEHRKMAKVDKNYLNRACRDFTGRAVRAVPGNDGWQVAGMTCVLKHHQLLGTAFMRRRERSDDNPHGGICADQMGLGKTIMTLANIVNGRPPRGDNGPKTTLIVATPALISQWMGEITKHTVQEKKPNWTPLKVLKWHGSSKPWTNDRLGGIPDYDIVLTTYDEVRKSYPKEDYPISLQTRQERESWWQQFYEENKGTLHRVDYLRVVLDEAQAIKNHKSHTSIACRGLMAKHRWALSGTPIQNAPKELFPYFKFLQVEHTGTFRIFCQNFIGTHSDGSLSKVGLDRLHSFLSRFMIRRTHADQLMGAPIVSLPRASERICWCRFNDMERAIYEMVRARMIQRINRLSRTRQLENSYSNILTMLLRLRQLTGHILALEQPMKDLLEKEDHEKIYDLALEARQFPESGHDDKMRALRAELYSPGDDPRRGKHSAGIAGVRLEENEQDIDGDRADSVHGSSSTKDCSDVGRHHGKKYDFMRYLENLKDGISGRNADDRSACGYCNDIAEEPWKTQCYHVYCRKCLEVMGEQAAARGLEGARCVVCQTLYTKTSPCDRMNFNQDRDLDDDSMDDYSDQELLRRKPKKTKNKRPMFVEKAKDWIDLADGNDILPSAKTLAIKAQIINWLQEDPNMKIIIYTQFMDMIRILSKVCSAEKWKYATYHGGKTHEARDAAIQEFSENPDMRILLASLRCGGVGLNLTMAQKVAVVDPWWNSSVEQQAFCRVFRIGQEQETSMTRFVVEKTVDENMIRMQERKQKEIDSVMDNDQHRKLTIPELLRLFGDVGADENGNPFVLVNNRNTRPNPNGDMEDEGYDDD
ncbi:hypothetical protein FKW77_001974 [Venturia effusa]|uniref:DNA repair protein rad5 n=1 Tax=Venturia effusa TaxID=50376 RepID=A0A517LC02_9PEZI|nr:hypothetical protein FKW77_001974 [Venturia effusa]